MVGDGRCGAVARSTVEVPHSPDGRSSTMRVSSVFVAAASASLLFLAVPGSASAADGHFEYTYVDQDGERHRTELTDPPSTECVDLPHLTGHPAYDVDNETGSTAILFEDAGCEGESHPLPPGASASNRLLVRSVLFQP
jgi:hypothetical protein